MGGKQRNTLWWVCCSIYFPDKHRKTSVWVFFVASLLTCSCCDRAVLRAACSVFGARCNIVRDVVFDALLSRPCAWLQDSWISPFQFSQTAKGKAPKEAWGGWLSGGGINVAFLRLHEPQLSAICCVVLNQIDPSYLNCIWSFVILCSHYSTLSLPLPFRGDKISRKRASFLIVCVDWFYKQAVWGVVKSWEFEGILRCSKIVRIRRENPMKWVLSISRDYWVYFDFTSQSFKIW